MMKHCSTGLLKTLSDLTCILNVCLKYFESLNQFRTRHLTNHVDIQTCELGSKSN